MRSAEVSIRQFQQEDIPAALPLVRQVGWNQVAADLRFLIGSDPNGCWVTEAERRVVGTTTTLRHGDSLGWIGMVIVDPEFRRQGIATRLMERAVTYLEQTLGRRSGKHAASAGRFAIKLDATEKGARVYEQLGFAVEYPVERWVREGVGGSVAPRANKSLDASRIRGLSETDLETCLTLDLAAFGAPREELSSWYLRNDLPAFAIPGRGFVVGRPGHWATQMGPLVARDEGVARELMGAFLREVAVQDIARRRTPAFAKASAGRPGRGGERKPVIADVAEGNREAVRLLREFGFQPQRVLHRMVRGGDPTAAHPSYFCLAGFEFG